MQILEELALIKHTWMSNTIA